MQESGAGVNEGRGDSAESLIESNFTEGSQLPEGWPVDLIPLPPGTTAVASLSKTFLPGTAGPATAVLYSTARSPQEVQDFLVGELPKRGWTLLESSPPGEAMVTAAQGNGYVGIFSSGKGFGSLEAEGAEALGMQIVLAELPEGQAWPSSNPQ
jgi:hypothetical protein